MKKIFFILILTFFLSACSFGGVKKAKVKINDRVIIAEVVETMADQARGLSGRKSLGGDEGMLFVYSQKNRPTFWMKDMLFPIDIIWIADDKIVDIGENLPVPDGDNVATAQPKDEINYVLEVNAGFVQKNSIKIGDRVELTK
jgi:hypothetical protein